MLRIFILILLVGTCLYLTACAGLYFSQRALLYHPQPSLEIYRALPKLKLAVKDAELSVSIRPHKGADALIFFGGNAENVAWSMPLFSSLFPDYAIYLPDYRGYGDSTGKPSEEALHNDALSLFDKVYAQHSNVVVVGRSLGSGVAVRLASQRPVARLMLVTPYDSILNVAQSRFPWFPIQWLLIDKFESWRYAPKISVPTLLVAAENDEVISYASTENLFHSFGKNVASLKMVAGTNHVNIFDKPSFLEWIRLN